MKFLKASDKKNILKAYREKKFKYKGTKITMATYFSSETIKARRKWDNILKVLKEISVNL